MVVTPSDTEFGCVTKLASKAFISLSGTEDVLGPIGVEWLRKQDLVVYDEVDMGPSAPISSGSSVPVCSRGPALLQSS